LGLASQALLKPGPCLVFRKRDSKMTTTSLPVLFVGTGIMGAPMARNLALSGFDVTAWNRTAEKAKALESDGVTVIEDLVTLPELRRIAILMLSTGGTCSEILFGSGQGDANLASRLLPGSLVIVMSSIPVETARQQAARLAALGIGYVDAPVSGGEKGAIEGALSIMGGGNAEDVAQALPVFSPMGRFTHVGPTGSGQLAKLANQTIVGITIGAVAEALLLAEAGGADVHAVRAALIGGFADSTILKQHGERMLSGNFQPGAYAYVQLKDVDTAERMASALELNLPLLSETRKLYEQMCGTSLRDLDHSALYLFLKQCL